MFCDQKRELNFCNGYLSLLYFWIWCIITQHVEEKPISDIAFLDYCVDDFSSDESESDVEQVCPHLRTNDYNDPVDYDKEAKDAEKDEPEPQEDVDFL